MDPIVSLIAANIAFVGGHIVMSHPLRAALVTALGERGFLGLYTLVNFVIFAWIVMAFRQIGASGDLAWNGASDALWIVGSLLTILAMVLLAGSFKGNPAIPDTSSQTVRQAQAKGVFAVTRHPMMWAIAMWGIAHMLVWPSARTLVTASAMGGFALLGAHLQDRKKQALLGDAWKEWEARTNYWPRWSRLGEIGIGLWLAGLVGWLALTWLHVWLNGIPAGIWRWMG